MLIFCTLISSGESSSENGTKHTARENPTKKIRLDTDTNNSSNEGMVLIPSGKYTIGSKDPESKKSEGPEYEVEVDAFFMDATEVTNAQWREFVNETNYATVAERPVDWEEIKLQLPPGTPKPDDAILEPGSMVFNPSQAVNLYDFSPSCEWTSDRYQPDTHSQNNAGGVKDCINPTGPNQSYDSYESLVPKSLPKKVLSSAVTSITAILVQVHVWPMLMTQAKSIWASGVSKVSIRIKTKYKY